MSEEKYKVQIKDKGGSTVEISAEIPADEFESHRKEVVRELGEDVAVPGFRKGHVPEKILVEKIGEDKILYEMAEKALRKAYPRIIAEKKIDVIGEPKIQITKIAKENALGFKAETAVLPEIKLPDYKKIAKEKGSGKKEEPSVTDEDMENATNRIKASIAMEEVKKGERKGELLKDKDGKPILPELTEEKVKELGYESMDDFKEKLREGLSAEKKRAEKEKNRLAIAEEIIKHADIEIPEILVRSELQKMYHQFEVDIKRMGMKPEEYIKNAGKTREDMEKEWRPDAKKRIQLELVLGKIAGEENIKAEKEDIDREVKHMLSHHPDANEAHVRAYVTNLLSREKVFEFLENQGL